MTAALEDSLPQDIKKQQQHDRIAFLPTPKQIQEACLEIQKGWTEEEFYGRAKFSPSDLYSARLYEHPPVEIREVPIGDGGLPSHIFAGSTTNPSTLRISN